MISNHLFYYSIVIPLFSFSATRGNNLLLTFFKKFFTDNGRENNYIMKEIKYEKNSGTSRNMKR